MHLDVEVQNNSDIMYSLTSHMHRPSFHLMASFEIEILREATKRNVAFVEKFLCECGKNVHKQEGFTIICYPAIIC